MTASDSNKLSADEIALYDRQIRLWGMAAQANMRSARVLLVNIGSIGTEVAKNVVLSGIGNLYVLDEHVVREEDLGCQFLLTKGDVGAQRAQACLPRLQDLNPRVNLQVDCAALASKPREFFQGFDLIVATELRSEEITALNKTSRALGIPIYVAGSNGLFSYIFVDLIQFESTEEKLKSGRSTECGRVSSNREVIDVQVRHDEDDPKKVYEKITTRNSYKPFHELLQSATLQDKLTRRQAKRVNNVLPLTVSCLTQHPGSLKDLQRNVVQTCNDLHITAENLKPEYIEQFYTQLGIEFAPVAAIIGGAVAQDVINILGKKASPLNNFLVFDGITLEMPIYEF